VSYGSVESGRIPNSEHEAQPWRIHEIVRDFILEDVWALPVEGDADEFPAFLELAGALDPTEADSRATRSLWKLRDLLGKWFDLGEIHVEDGAAAPAEELPIPGTAATTLASRLPDNLRGTAAGLDFASLPFSPLYRIDREAAAEVSNKTVHGVAHFAWVDQGDGSYRAQMAVYVKPRGLFGRAYMAAIKPFRYLIVYPALLREFGRAWSQRRPKSPPDPVAEMGDAGALQDPDRLQLDVVGAEVLEEAAALAEEDGDEVDLDLVEDPGR
jgi:hypothetical protein